MPIFYLPLFLLVQHFLQSSNPPCEVGVPYPVASMFLKQSQPAPLGLGLNVLAPFCPTLQQDHSGLIGHR